MRITYIKYTMAAKVGSALAGKMERLARSKGTILFREPVPFVKIVRGHYKKKNKRGMKKREVAKT